MSVSASIRLSTRSPGDRLALGVSVFSLILLVRPALADPAATSVQLPDVTVTADAPDGSAASGYRYSSGSLGPFGDVPVKEIPFSLNTTSGQLIENTNAHTIGDALMTNPTATVMMSSTGYSSMSRIMVRGFNASDQDEMRDGLVDRSFEYVPLENVDRIEVLNGLSGFLNGFSQPGGTINYVSKQPTATPLNDFSTGVYGGRMFFEHADLGGTLSENGTGKFGYRVNLYQEDGPTTIDGSRQDRGFVSGRFTYDASTETRFWTDFYHQSLSQQGLATYINPASGVKLPSAAQFAAGTQYGQDWTYNRAEKNVVGLGFDAHLNDSITARVGYRYGSMWRDYSYVDGTLTDNLGDYKEINTASPEQHEQTDSGYVLFDAKVDTASIHHTFTFGFTGTDYLYSRGTDVTRTLGTTNLDDLIGYANPGLIQGGTNQWQKQLYSNYVFGDRAEITDRFALLAGVTRAELRQIAWGPGVSSISSANYSAGATTPSFGATYKILPNLTGYLSYAQALEAGDTAPSTALNAYQILAPSISDQYEAGLKGTFGGLDLSAALFHINKVNAELNPNNHIYMQDGREIHEGLEVMAAGKLADQWTLNGGFTLLHAYVGAATANPATIGNIPVNVPEAEARLRLEYAVPSLSGVVVSFGPDFLGRRPIDVYNQQFIAPATLFDAGFRYERDFNGHKVSGNLTVENLFNTAYWAYYRTGDGLLLGAPRTVAFTLKVSL